MMFTNKLLIPVFLQVLYFIIVYPACSTLNNSIAKTGFATETSTALKLQFTPPVDNIPGCSDTTGGYWVNPVIPCSLNTKETPVKQYPYKSGKSHKERIDTSGFLEFCSRMELRFENSGVPLSMADSIYSAILEKNIVRDGSYGMPSPGRIPAAELTLEEIKARVKIRKTGEGMYEIFYRYTGCGTNYVHESIVLKNGKITGRKKKEAWSGSYPC